MIRQLEAKDEMNRQLLEGVDELEGNVKEQANKRRAVTTNKRKTVNGFIKGFIYNDIQRYTISYNPDNCLFLHRR